MVVAAQRQRRAVAAGAGDVGVAQNVAGAVDAGAFAVPDAEHAVVARLPQHVMDLAAQHRGGGQVLVHAGDEMDAMLVEQRLHAAERQVVASQRRAFVAGDECGGVQPGATIAAHLVHGQPHQRLDAGEIDGPLFGGIAIVKIHECPTGMTVNQTGSVFRFRLILT